MKTIQLTAAEIAERTARFDALQPMSTMKDNTRVSQAAKDIIFARKIMPIVLERTRNPRARRGRDWPTARRGQGTSRRPPRSQVDLRAG